MVFPPPHQYINPETAEQHKVTWSENYGASEDGGTSGANGTLEQTGADIYTTVTGSYLIAMNDQSKTYSLVVE
ncbi:MAG: hypothetical protein ACI8WB_004977 [Phenylobacterium sp.]